MPSECSRHTATAHGKRKRKPNQYGIYDMIGNAEEWVADGFRDRQSKNFGKPDHGGRRNRNNAIQWPVEEFLKVYPNHGKRLLEAMRQSNQTLASGMPVAKGGSGLSVGGPLVASPLTPSEQVLGRNQKTITAQGPSPTCLPGPQCYQNHSSM